MQSPALSVRTRRSNAALAPGTARAVLAVTMAAAVWLGAEVSPRAEAVLAVAQAGPELTRLLRAMAGLKLLFAAAATAAVWWRLALPVSPLRMAGYAAAAAAMAAGPCLVWDMAHVAAGAVLLHGGLAASVLLVWRDPATVARLRQKTSGAALTAR